MSAPLAIVFAADGCEETEALATVDILRRGGVDVCVMSVSETTEVAGAHGIRFAADSLWDAAAVAAADLLVVPGGMGGMQRLRADGRVLDALRAAIDSGRRVAAICAGPCVPARAGVLAGRRAICYPGMEGELAAAGATPDDSGAPVVVDGPVVTSKGPGTVFDFGIALVEALRGAEVAETVAQGMLLR